MSISTEYKLRRRRRVHAMRAKGATVEQIAARLGIGVSTVKRDLKLDPGPEPYQAVDRLRPDSAVKDGTNSEPMLAPVRARYLETLRGRYPAVTDERLQLLASLWAKVELAERWLDMHGLVKDDADGEPFPVAVHSDRWAARLDQLLSRLDAEQAERDKPTSILERQLRGLPTGGNR